MTTLIGGLRLSRAVKHIELRRFGALFFLLIAMAFASVPQEVSAQSYRFSSVQIEGNQRIGGDAIVTYAGIARGQTVTAAQLNDAYQRIVASGLFETVEIVPRGNTLVIKVVEYPTINRISFEGNKRIKDDVLGAAIQSQPRRVLSPSVVESDAAVIADAYAQEGRLSARVSPKIIRRSDNRVDLVFEIFEGSVIEIERLSFVGNEAYSDRRLRRVLSTKQAGILRQLIRADTFVKDRIAFDEQVLRDFYQSRGYVDFRITGSNVELSEERDAYFMVINVQEGQQFRLGAISASSDLSNVDVAEFDSAHKLRSGAVYSPSLLENAITRLERLAVAKGLDFIRVEPRITRNDRDLSLDVDFQIKRGKRIFVERIDIEGNVQTLDRVIRQQFKIAEGDPFNPREIRQSAERIRALGYFGNSSVKAREGSAPDQVVIDVDVEEQPTGSLTLGGSYSTNSGLGAVIKLSEDNFLGRGQRLVLSYSGADDESGYGLSFVEPAFLGREVSFQFALKYTEAQGSYSNYDSTYGSFRTGFSFPLSENGRFGLFYQGKFSEMSSNGSTIGGIVASEIALGEQVSSSLSYEYSYDTRRTGLDPTSGWLFEFGQELGGLGGDTEYVKSTARAIAQKKILHEEVTLRATLEAGMLTYGGGTTGRSIDRFNIGAGIMRGFEPNGIGPREFNAVTGVDDALGGDMFAVAKFEAEFPLGLPEEYGISGGLFYDVGSVWGLDDISSATNSILYEGFTARHVVGLSVFWTTPIGPLRFNFSKALQKEAQDIEQTFNLTIATTF